MFELAELLVFWFPPVLGQVGDMCPRCIAIRPMVVRAKHAGLMPQIVHEQRRSTGHTAECAVCGAKSDYDIRRARRLNELGDEPLEQLCEETNPDAARALHGGIVDDALHEASRSWPSARWAMMVQPLLDAEADRPRLKRLGRPPVIRIMLALCVVVIVGGIIVPAIFLRLLHSGTGFMLAWIAMICAAGLAAAAIATYDNSILGPRRVERWLAERMAELRLEQGEIEALLDWASTVDLLVASDTTPGRFGNLLDERAGRVKG